MSGYTSQPMEQPIADDASSSEAPAAPAASQAAASATDASAKPAPASTASRIPWRRIAWALGTTIVAMAVARIPFPTGGSVLQGSFQEAMGKSLWLGLGVS